MLKIGLIGCGFMGAMHTNCYRNIEDVKITAFADVRREKAEELCGSSGAKIYADGKELIENADVDIIDICLPTYLHAEYALLAMEKVKYLFVEKPVALTNEQAKAMIEKAESTHCNVQIGQVIRFWDEYMELQKIVEDGRYGKVVNAFFRRLSPRPDWGWEDWALNPELSGGAAQDLHIHDVDYVLSLFGCPDRFYTVRNASGEPNSYISTLFRYGDKVITVEGTWDLPATYAFDASFRVVFEKAVVENAGGRFAVYDREKITPIVIEKKELAGATETKGNLSDLGGYYNELVYFTDRAKAGERIEKATLQAASASLEFLLKEIAFS